ncbi:MAG TPA: hypothetical protein VJZ68_03915 [Nitrososphaera sp.]|nr:hypothetical protein [Nitrososphaera sp.]
MRAIAGPDMMPLGVPERGSLGVALEASGLPEGDQFMITFVCMANAESPVPAEILYAVQLPFYVAENSQAESNATGLEIRDSFVNRDPLQDMHGS